MPKNTAERIIDRPLSGRQTARVWSGSSTSTTSSGDDSPTVNSLLGVEYITLNADTLLTNERYLAVSSALTKVDSGAGNALTIGLNTPGTLSVSSTDNASGSHTHAITASSAPGAAEALLKSSSAGELTLPLITASTRVRTPLIDTASGGLTLSPNSGVIVANAILTIPKAVSTSAYNALIQLQDTGTAADSSTGIDWKNTTHTWDMGRIAVVRAGSAANFHMAFSTSTSGVLSEKVRILNTGNVLVNTTTDGGYKLDVNGTVRIVTSVTTPLITTATNVDLVINPAGTGAVQFPNDQTLRTSSFDSSFPITGWQINEVSGVPGYSSLTIGKIQADELAVRVFVADEVRVDRGDEYWTKSYGILAETFTTPPSIGGTVSVKFEDSPALVGAIFSNNDWVLLRKLEIDTGLTLFNVWGQVSSYVNNSDGTQNWTFTLRSGPTSEEITKGSLAIDFGASGAALIHLSVIDSAGAPYIKMRKWAGANPYTPANYTTYVQLGHLGSIGNSYVTPAGFGLYVRSTGDESRFLLADDNGLQIRGASLALYNGADQTVNIDSAGTDIWVGPNSTDKRLYWNGVLLSVKGAIEITAASSFSGSGYLQVGSGTKDSTLNGFNMNSSEFVGQASGVDQVVMDTDGIIKAGAGAVWLDVNGVNLAVEPVSTTPSYLRFMNGGSLKGSIGYFYTAGPIPDPADGMNFYADTGNKFRFLNATSTEFAQTVNVTGSVTATVGMSVGGTAVSLATHNHNSTYLALTGGTLTGTVITDVIRPAANNTDTVGDASYYYNAGYFNNLYVNTIVGTPSYSHTHAATDITSGTLNDARLPTTMSGKTFSGAIILDADTASTQNYIRWLTDVSGNKYWGLIGRAQDHATTAQRNDLVLEFFDGSSFYTGFIADSGTRVIDFAQIPTVSGTAVVLTSRTVTAGSAMTGGGDLSGNITISHADTSTQASVDNSGYTVIQDVTLDTYGHVTALASVDAAVMLSGYLKADGTVTGATSQAQAFTNGVVLGSIYPPSNSTTAVRIRDAGGSNSVVVVDTTNLRVGINTTPATLFEASAATDGSAVRVTSRQNDSGHSTTTPYASFEIYKADASGFGAGVASAWRAYPNNTTGNGSNVTLSVNAGVSPGEVEVLFLNSSGNAGIGSASATNKFQVYDATYGNLIQFIPSAMNGYGFDAGGAGLIVTGGTDSVGQDAGFILRNEQSNNKWVFGLDSSDGDAFHISTPNFNANNIFTLLLSGAASFVGDVEIGGELMLSDGTAGTPSLTFDADTDNGIYRSTTNTWHLAAGGSAIATITAAGVAVTGIVTASTSVATPVVTTASGALSIAPTTDLLLSPNSGLVKSMPSTALQSDNYASQTTGWRMTYGGALDARNIYTDELHAKAFIADLEQALAGLQIISKSVAILAEDFVAPYAGGQQRLVVDDLPSAANMAAFQANDYVLLRSFNRSGGSLSIGNCWGQVTGYTDGTGTQTWTFTRSGTTTYNTIAIRGTAQSNASSSSTSTTVTKPTGVISGDFLLAIIVHDGTADVITASGWTLAAAYVSGSDINGALYYKVAGGSEPANYTFSTVSSHAIAASIVAYTNVVTAQPFDGTPTLQANAASTSMATASAWASSTAGRAAFMGGVTNNTSVTPPGGMSELIDAGATGIRVYVADEALVASGQVARTATIASSFASVAATVVLRPTYSAMGSEAGSITPGTTINADAVVLDFGVSGNGYYEVNAIDGAYAANSPYTQIVTWTTHPATGKAVRSRWGNLNGVSIADYGLVMGTDVSSSATRTFDFRSSTGNLALGINGGAVKFDGNGNSYFAGVMTIDTAGEIRQGTGTLGSNFTGLRIWQETGIGRIAGYSSAAVTPQWQAGSNGKLYVGGGNVELDATGITVYYSGIPRLKLNPTDSSFALGPTVPTYASGDGVWMGIDSGYVKMRIGKIAGERLVWDGSNLEVHGAIKISSPSEFSGSGYLQVGSGTKDSTLNGFNINSSEFVGQTSGVDQIVLGSDGRFKAGAGNVILDANGVSVIGGSAFRLMEDASTLKGYLYSTNPLDSLLVNSTGVGLKTNGTATVESVSLRANASGGRSSEIAIEGGNNSSTNRIRMFVYSGNTSTSSQLTLGETAFTISVSGIAANDFSIDANGNVAIAGDLDMNGNDIVDVATLGIGTSSPDSLQVSAAVSSTARGVDNVRIGVESGAPRIIFEDATYTQWLIDNSAGSLRFFNPGSVRATLTTTGNLSLTGTIATANNTPWDLRSYTATAPSATGYVTVVISGVTYKLLAST